MAARAIGLDVGCSAVRAAEVSVRNGEATLEHYGQVALPPGVVRDGEVVDLPAAADAVRRLWAGGKFSHKKVMLGVANRHMVVRQVDLPWVPDKELKASLPMVVGDMIPMPVESAVLDFIPLEELVAPDGTRELRGLLLAASEQVVLDLVSVATEAGLTVAGVDLTAFAVLRAVTGPRRPVDPHAEPTAVIDIGAGVTNIVVHQGGAPRFVRVLMMGGDDVTTAIVDGTGLPQPDAEMLKRALAAGAVPPGGEDPRARMAIDNAVAGLLAEVRGSLDYYVAQAGGRPLREIVLSGGATLTPGLAQALQRSVRATIVPAATFRRVRMGKTGLDDAQLAFSEPSAAVPVGLALGGAA